jgi:hypothetical protein
MKLLSLSKYFYLVVFLLNFCNNLHSEDAVDIWKKNKELSEKENNNSIKNNNSNSIFSSINKKNKNKDIEIEQDISEKFEETKLYGIFDPNNNDFTLYMWSRTSKNEFNNIIKRINKLDLSPEAENIFVKTLFSDSYHPSEIKEEEFIKVKIDWLIQNEREDLIEQFLKKNKNFPHKGKLIQYLVDKNISRANIVRACENMGFISKDIKDIYLDKFNIYCLIFNNKKNQAQLLFDILKEQGKSDNFFDDKINYLLGITKKTNNKIYDNNLLNFYLSSVTVKDFKYEPNNKTKKFIWEYLNSANLIELDEAGDKEKIKNFEIAANKNRLDKNKIFEFYKKIKFDLNTLINAESIHQTLPGIDARALLYQKYLLSDKIENKIELLFELKNLFKKEKLSNVFTLYMSEQLKALEVEQGIPKEYLEAVKDNIVEDVEVSRGKIKYDDKILHRSRILKYFTENNKTAKKTEKDLIAVYKKIKKNRDYFFSAKDLALVQSLAIDGIKIPKEIKYKEIEKKYAIPENLLNLVSDKQKGFLALKIVEIIGEDEIYNLDPETIFFIIDLLNRAELFKFRNQILTSALPLRA